MKKKESRLKADTTESVRIDRGVVESVREQSKEDEGLGIGQFFEVAAKEKLANRKQKNKEKQ